MKQAFLFLALSLFLSLEAAANEIYLIPTLHQVHDEVTNYSYDDLKGVLERIKPDILLVELTKNDIKAEKEQRNKVEYNRVVLPYAKANEVPMVALEPDEPLRSELINNMKANNLRAAKEDSVEVTLFDEFLGVFYDHFSDVYIVSGAYLTSPEFDRRCRLKHEIQAMVYGEVERETWDDWNQHFLDVTIRTNAENTDKKIAILVGAEHHYWQKEGLLKAKIQLTKVPF